MEILTAYDKFEALNVALRDKFLALILLLMQEFLLLPQNEPSSQNPLLLFLPFSSLQSFFFKNNVHLSVNQLFLFKVPSLCLFKLSMP